MRKLILSACLALGACDDGEDFALDVNVPAERAYADLSHLSGGAIVSMASLPAFGREKPQDGEIRYILHSVEGKGDAKIGFRVENAGPGKSRVHVAVDMPAVDIKINGADKYISEYKTEQVLRKLLIQWGKTRGSGEPATEQIAGINTAMGAFALVLSPGKLDSVTKLASSGLFDFGEYADLEDISPPSIEHAELRPQDISAPDPTYREERVAGADFSDNDSAASGSDWGE